MATANLDRAPVAADSLGTVPVIDISALWPQVVDGIAAACRDWGFFQVRGHGIPQSVMTGTLDAARASSHAGAGDAANDDATRDVGREPKIGATV